MKIKMGVIFLFFIVIVISMMGCVSSNKLSTIPPSEMALQISDLPAGYVKIDSGSFSDVQNYPSFGTVKKGYGVGFSKGSTTSDMVMISQIILVMPIDQINNVLPNFTSEVAKQGSKTDQLSSPHIGDSSVAFRVEDSTGNDLYIIMFVRQDVVEMIAMGGSQSDYDVLKNIAHKAESKIK
jgi:hypothetical protein